MPSLSTILSVSLIIVSSLCSTAHAKLPPSYELVDDYSGKNFFDKFKFFTIPDYTNGFVQYVNRSYAERNGLIRASKNKVYMGVDTKNKFLDPSGPGRPSVRIESLATYNHGLFILNLTHFPWGCGAWPAFWTLGPNWPYTGEVDIAEGVNLNQYNVASLHTDTGCTIAGARQTGTLLTSNCDSTGPKNVGCGVLDSEATSYGPGFNAVGGGLFVMQWTSKYIRVWTFRPDQVPSSIRRGKPKPMQFGYPDANLQGDCNIDKHFRDHYIVFDITFCGDYAGEVYSYSGCPRAERGHIGCNEYVGSNPADFTEAYWDINYLHVYQTKGPRSLGGQFTVASLSSATPAAATSPAVTKSLLPPAMGDSTTPTATPTVSIPSN